MTGLNYGSRSGMPHHNRHNNRHNKMSRGLRLRHCGIVIILFLLFFAGTQVLPGLDFLPQPQPGDLLPEYRVLIELTLPGVRSAGKSPDPLNEPESGTHPNWTFSEYAHYLLYRELSGFGEIERVPYTTEPEYSENEADVGQSATEPSPSGEHLSLIEEEEELSVEDPFLSLNENGEPLVLIYHSHTTESFIPEAGEPFTSDLSRTVVALGEELSRTLEEKYGIPTLHHREIFDIPRRYAYEKARPGIKEILEENPQIEVVIDLHRDGVSRSVTTASLEGRDTGKIMFVVGSRHEGWYSNMRFALFLQGELDSRYPELNRGVRQHNFVYNQDLHQRSVLVEVGGYKNSMDEVKRAIPCLAEILAKSFEG